MDDAASEHPDEGTIHAWLDGALDAAAAQALAAHVASCASCAERVAEARGLIAGASRIVRALDAAPSGASGAAPVSPAWGQAPAATAATRATGRPAWRRFRVTPARAAIAATMLVALGVSLTYRRTAIDSEASRVLVTAPAMPPQAAPTGTRFERDTVLDSAVARNVAKAQPRRVVEAAPGPAPIVPEPPPSAAAAMADVAAPARVAAGRAAVAQRRVTDAGLAPDQLAAKARPQSRDVDEKVVAAAVHADSVGRGAAGSVATGATASSVLSGKVPGVLPSSAECVRVESANATAATWGPVALPLVVRLDSTGRASQVLTVAGQPTDAYAVVTRAGEDSVLLRLRRLGFEGTLALAGRGDTRAGVMRSRPLQTQLEALVVTGVDATPNTTDRRRVPTRKEVPAAAAPAASAEERSAANAAPAVPVVGRRVVCP